MVGARTVRADNSDALLFEHFFIICRAKVGVDNVEIRYRDLLPFLRRVSARFSARLVLPQP